MKFLILSIILFVILFCPIPIVINFSYINKKLSLHLWKFNLLNKDSNDDSSKNIDISKIFKKKENNIPKKKKFKIEYKKLIKKLRKNPYKIKLKLTYNLDYSLGDAANEAIVYGLLWDINSVLIVIFDTFFKFKPIACGIKPHFKNLTFFNFAFKSIFYISLGQIIFILIYTLSCIRRCPLRE